jgi:GMP synthase (glutamine-hydrolysing)
MNKVLVLDFGSQYTQLIARKIRELGVYSEILPFHVSVETLRKKKPGALVLSGGPGSVYDEDAPMISRNVFFLNIPVLGICYGYQLMAYMLGGDVASSTKKEYGFASLEIKTREGLLSGMKDRSRVWMSHGDRVEKTPAGFKVTGATENCDTAVIENGDKGFFGVQFHPEVIHTDQGNQILANFLFKIAGLKPDWNMESFIEKKVTEIRQKVGERRVICGLSGGVDSLVTAVLVDKAIGSRLVCIFVDNGLLRRSEYTHSLEQYKTRFGLRVDAVKAASSFLIKLKGVSSPERKRKIIGKEFIRIFEEEARKLGKVEFLAQGTIYPDVIESNPVKGPSASIKSHHNVGGLPESLNFQLVEPLRELFKDEVRKLGREMGVDEDFLQQHPFPGPGLAVRIIGDVTPQRIQTVRAADAIVVEEVKKAGLYADLWQAFAILLPVRTVGVMGDKRTYHWVVAVRLVQSRDGMTADWYQSDPMLLTRISNRIVNEVKDVNRVVYDITSKPPGTIEWE